MGGGKGDLQKVLEVCTRELLKHERYNRDVRFLRIWIQYVSYLQHTAVVCPRPVRRAHALREKLVLNRVLPYPLLLLLHVGRLPS